MTIELTVLGASGSYGAPAGGACSGYLVRTGNTALWMDCGNGTFANLQRHLPLEDLTAVIITHRHPDHCVDLYGLHVAFRYFLERPQPPVYAAPEVLAGMAALAADFPADFPAWHELADGAEHEVGEAVLRASRTDHPPPTFAVEVGAGGKRLVYTSDTGPGWSPEAFGPGADLVLSEATYQEGHTGDPVHLTARQAGALARDAGAKRLMITHLSPLLDPGVSVAEAEAEYGSEAILATPHLRVRI